MALLATVSLYAATGTMALAAVTAPAAPASAADETDENGARAEVVAETGTDLRQAPDQGAEVLASLPNGERVTVICVAEGDSRKAWYLLHTDHYAWAPATDVKTTGADTFWC